MNIKQNYKKIIGISFIVNVIVVSLMAVLVLSPANNNFTISDGIYPQGTYTFWREGATYYAKYIYGSIDYFGANFSQIINQATSAIDGTFFLTDGTYELDTSILIDTDDSILAHSPNAVLSLSANVTAIRGRENGLRRIYLKNFLIDGNMNEGTNGINFSDSTDSIESSTITGVQFTDIEGTNIFLKEAYQIDIFNIHLGWNTGTYISETGIELEGCGGINIEVSGIYACNNLIVLDGGYQAQVIGNSFYYYNTSVINVDSNGFSQLKFNDNKIRGNFNGSGDPTTNAYHAIYVYVGVLHYSTILGNTFQNIRREAIVLQRAQTVDIGDNTLWNTAYETNNTYSSIWLNGSSELYNTVYNDIHDNTFYTMPSWGQTKSAIEIVGNASWTGYNKIHHNTITGTYGTDEIIPLGENNEINHNIGWRTENSGSVLLTTGTWVAHGLAGTPTSVVITARLGGLTYGITGRTSTQFQIAHSGGNDYFDWYAEYKP